MEPIPCASFIERLPFPFLTRTLSLLSPQESLSFSLTCKKYKQIQEIASIVLVTSHHNAAIEFIQHGLAALISGKPKLLRQYLSSHAVYKLERGDTFYNELARRKIKRLNPNQLECELLNPLNDLTFKTLNLQPQESLSEILEQVEEYDLELQNHLVRTMHRIGMHAFKLLHSLLLLSSHEHFRKGSNVMMPHSVKNYVASIVAYPLQRLLYRVMSENKNTRGVHSVLAYLEAAWLESPSMPMSQEILDKLPNDSHKKTTALRIAFSFHSKGDTENALKILPKWATESEAIARYLSLICEQPIQSNPQTMMEFIDDTYPKDYFKDCLFQKIATQALFGNFWEGCIAAIQRCESEEYKHQELERLYYFATSNPEGHEFASLIRQATKKQ